MEGERLAFRTAAVGGFNKQDVIVYIQATARNFNEQISRLKDELAKERAARELAQRQASSMEQTVQSGADETALAAQLEEAMRENAELKARREEDALEHEALRARLEQAEHDAAASKARAAGVEAESQHRARQAIAAAEAAADAAAAALKEECDGHLAQIQTQYTKLRGNIVATVHQATSELERAQKALISAMDAFHEDGV